MFTNYVAKLIPKDHLGNFNFPWCSLNMADLIKGFFALPDEV